MKYRLWRTKSIKATQVPRKKIKIVNDWETWRFNFESGYEYKEIEFFGFKYIYDDGHHIYLTLFNFTLYFKWGKRK